jgi:hypothetical protein
MNQTTSEWEIRSGVVQAVDSDGLLFKTDEGTTRATLGDDGNWTFTGTVTSANISDGTDTVATGYVVNGSAKAWVNFDGTGTAAISDSLNMSSLTDNGTGDYTLTYSNSLTGVFSNIVACSQSGRSSTQRAMAYDSATANSFVMGTYIDTGSTQTAFDNSLNDAAVFGDLA